MMTAAFFACAVALLTISGSNALQLATHSPAVIDFPIYRTERALSRRAVKALGQNILADVRSEFVAM